MSDLIERLEKATGPDSQLDVDIFFAEAWTGQGDERLAPKYTASIDAALTLVPENGRLLELGQWQNNGVNDGWFCQVTRWFKTGECSWEDRGFAIGISEKDSNVMPPRAPTAALALCIAALKAREAQP